MCPAIGTQLSRGACCYYCYYYYYDYDYDYYYSCYYDLLLLLLLLQVLLYPASDLVDYGLKCRLKQKVLKLMVFRLGSYLGVTGVWLQVWAKPRNQTPTTLR